MKVTDEVLRALSHFAYSFHPHKERARIDDQIRQSVLYTLFGENPLTQEYKYPGDKDRPKGEDGKAKPLLLRTNVDKASFDAIVHDVMARVDSYVQVMLEEERARVLLRSAELEIEKT